MPCGGMAGCWSCVPPRSCCAWRVHPQHLLLPVLLPLAPVSTLTSRIADQITAVLSAHGAPAAIVDQERQHMRTVQLGVTANRGVVGVMTEFTRLAEAHHEADDLVGLAMRLAETPRGPLYRRNVSPDRELAATLHTLAN